MIFKRNRVGGSGLTILFVLCSFLGTGSANAAQNLDYIITFDGSGANVLKAVQDMGGIVTYKYDNIPAVAISLPADRRDALAAVSGIGSIYKDRMVAAPAPVDTAAVDPADLRGAITGPAAMEALRDSPDGYFRNFILSGAADLVFGQGLTGDGVLVAVIDTGTANVDALDGRIVGGENFVPGEDEPSATSALNGPHGTWVGSTMAGNIIFCFPDAALLAQALFLHAPESISENLCDEGVHGVAMFGTAPLASVYALKTFAAAGGGAPESRIIAAMDRAITQRINYNNGMPVVPVSGDGSEDNPFVYDSLPIDIVNMSLGGPTLFAGRDLEDSLTQKMLEVGIVLVASAGNDGHAAITGGSAGTGIGSLTSGAVSLAANERILRELQLASVFGLGIGGIYRPTSHPQMATFSSRGPTADGRIDPDNVASGFAVFAQSANGGLSLVSGTSFSAPHTSGLAALLREAMPEATARDIRDALIHSSNPFFLGDHSGEIDQGAGWADGVAALSLLKAWSESPDDREEIADVPFKPKKSVATNLQKAGYETIKFKKGSWSTRLENLVPGQVAHIFVESTEETDALRLTIANVQPELSPAEQNLLFGDDLFIEVVDAPTSFDPLLVSEFVNGDARFDIPNPQTGIIRIAVMGDWTNAGMISADIMVEESTGKSGPHSAQGKIMQDAFDQVEVEIPAGTSEAVFELSWQEHWGHYPTDDVDMFLFTPGGGLIFDGATFASPERVVVSEPEPGTWTVVINGFAVFPDLNKADKKDAKAESKWELRVSADGNRIKESK